MADPLLARGIRAQVVLPGKSGLPEDRFVTTWAFQADGASADEADEAEVAADLIEFFNVAAAPSTLTVGSMISNVVNRNACEVRTYRMATSIPREVTVTPFTLGGSEIDGLPEEVALTLSFYSTRNLPRQRGRVYIGPLVNTISVADGTTGRRKPASDRQSSLVNAAIRLSQKPATRPEWCVLSRTAGVLYPITHGWVDDGFDTQRRRGLSAKSRVLFG